MGLVHTMLTKVQIRGFKSIESLEFDLGLLNVFIGANGSGKSNLLEAIGVLSAAASGRVDDESLLRRGVRPGLPQLFKTSFAHTNQPPHIFFSGQSEDSRYDVALFNPTSNPKPAWSYHTETWESQGHRIVGRSNRSKPLPNPEAGLAALKAVERSPGDPALQLLDALRDYAIFTPTTPTLRGLVPDQQMREPIGLSGGGLTAAVLKVLWSRSKSAQARQISNDALAMIDWAKSITASPSSTVPVSNAAGGARHVIRFRDRFMKEKHNLLSGYDASEGALYVLFTAVLAASPNSPSLFAIDNVDHGLNPRLTCQLMRNLCDWVISSDLPPQILLTTHNPLALDGLKLQDDRVRLFTVSRTTSGRTVVSRVTFDNRLQKLSKDGWTLSRLWVMGHLGGVANV